MQEVFNFAPIVVAEVSRLSNPEELSAPPKRRNLRIRQIAVILRFCAVREKRIALWKWAKPTRLFEPLENPYWTNAGLRFKSHNKVVHAGLNPVDWMETMGKDVTLHKIILTKQQAQLCVVAEACFRPTDEELAKFMEKKHISFVGSARSYTYEHYERSFVPLLRYSGDYNLPEVLIPFSVRAEIMPYGKVLATIWKRFPIFDGDRRF